MDNSHDSVVRSYSVLCFLMGDNSCFLDCSNIYLFVMFDKCKWFWVHKWIIIYNIYLNVGKWLFLYANLNTFRFMINYYTGFEKKKIIILIHCMFVWKGVKKNSLSLHRKIMISIRLNWIFHNHLLCLMHNSVKSSPQNKQIYLH